jgi:hypothetical protein
MKRKQRLETVENFNIDGWNLNRCAARAQPGQPRFRARFSTNLPVPGLRAM